MILRRLLLVGLLALVAMPLGAAPGLADELDDYLSAAQDADYAGRRIVVTIYADRSTAVVLDVEHARSTTLIEQGSSETVIGDGRRAEMGRTAGAIMLAGATTVRRHDRYRASSPERIVRLGRPADVVSVFEGQLLRQRIVFDVSTGAPLSTEVYDGDGRLFRFSSMIEIGPPHGLYDEFLNHEHHYEYEVIMPTAVAGLPAAAAGYQLGDTYGGPEDVIHAFYSDGLFTFSLFQFAGDTVPEGFGDAMETEINGDDYRVMATPTQLWVHWSTPGTSYILLGDLPPDHVEQVLADLPRPHKANLFSRIWNNFFG